MTSERRGIGLESWLEQVGPALDYPLLLSGSGVQGLANQCDLERRVPARALERQLVHLAGQSQRLPRGLR